MMKSYVTTIFLLLMALGLLAQQDQRQFASKSEKKEAADVYAKVADDRYNQGKFDESIIYYDSAISLDLKNTELYLGRAAAKESAGNYIAALVDFETIIRMDPYNPNYYFKRGLLYHRQKNFQLAIDDFTYVLLNSDFKETTAIIFKGEQANEGGEVRFSGITTIDKLKGEIYNARAQSFAKLEERQKAMEDFDKAMVENPNESVYNINRGLYYLELTDTLAAKNDFIRALKKRPGNKTALYNLAKISTVEERETLNKELYEDNEVSVIFSQRAYEKFLRGEYRSALRDYDSALYWMPKNAEDLMNRGIIKSRLKRPVSAIKDFDKSLKLNKSLVRNYYLIGNAFQTLRKYEDAITYYDFYLNYAAADAQVLYNKGIAQLKSGKKIEACQTLSKALVMGESRAAKAKLSACKK
ncbi:MAG: tetratricopeptide repeat protein [Cyclobacteriaceae bacterium]